MHTGIIVSVEFNITVNDTAQRMDELEDLSRIGDTDRIGNTHAIDTQLIGDAVDVQQIN